MENFIIIVILAVIAGLAVRSTVRHFKGQGGCCGGGGNHHRKKKLPRVLYTRTFQIYGLHCQNCCHRVEDAVNDIPGVAGKVKLHPGVLTVSYAEAVEDARIVSRIRKAGYEIKQ